MSWFEWLSSWRQSRSSDERIFGAIYNKRAWKGRESASGRGSDLEQTRVLRAQLPLLLSELRIATMLDVPCGDFHWMREVVAASTGVSYVGGEIVEALAESNNAHYRKDGIEFRRINLLADPLPAADLVFCRDCLVHLCEADAKAALRNIAAGSFSYVALTTFTDRTRNKDIRTGRWRPLNLRLAPFHLPAPLHLINEGCTEENGRFADKSIGIWRAQDLKV